jgi:hypothetical protein
VTTVSETAGEVDTQAFSPASAHWLEWAWTLIGGVSVRTKILGIVLTLTISRTVSF